MANAAAKAVWGEGQTNREPISGAKGDVARGEPYDAGNMETPYQERLENDLGSNTGSKTAENTTESEPAGRTTESTSFENVARSAPIGKTTEATPATTSHTENSAYASTDSPAQQEQQEAGLLNEADLKGTGPRPLEVVAKENGGDASPKSGSPDNVGRSENTLDSAVSGENVVEADSKGTGEEYVKASGLAADGGDFDATKPGAGREADRLLEQKGVHREDAAGPGGHSGSSHGDQKDKPSLGERIKAKFHKH